MLRRLLPVLLLAAALPTPMAQQAAPWQQEVRYEIDVVLLADRHRLRGTERVAYTNNSPDTLRHVFFHLYFNAFQPTSLMAERNRHLPDPDPRVVPRIFELEEDEQGWHEILALTQDGEAVDWRVYDTVLEVTPVRPIHPGETTTFELAFRSQVPLQTRRSGRDSREGIAFSMTQWYPKVAAYDAIGWHADPYVGREFYGPFATFDVRITAPADHVLGATGVLQNPAAVGHGYDATADSGGAGPTTAAPAAA
ncbi:MAG: M1 family peptidase, partial [Rhodothermales bacterium]|nr:M1 family peptidase [Rhodothermales bacterium]